MGELALVLAGAALSGVDVQLLEGEAYEVFVQLVGREWSPDGMGCGVATAGRVVFLRGEAECPDTGNGVPGWMRLLHEVAHAVTAKGAGVGYESSANAWELSFCLLVWGPHSPQTRACRDWASQGDWSCDDVRESIEMYQSGIWPAWRQS